MNRVETVALFRRCEAARNEASRAALAADKSENEAKQTAHDAAKAIWNAWAEAKSLERSKLETEGVWVVQTDALGSLEGLNEASRLWLSSAETNFTRCQFSLPAETGNDALDQSNSQKAAIELILVEGERIDFSGFKFPGSVRFDDVVFFGNARFNRAVFVGGVWFDRTQFTEKASFDTVSFGGTASFIAASFSSDAWFGDSSFSEDALFGNAKFASGAWFTGARFSGVAAFRNVGFDKEGSFDKVKFSGKALFGAANFSAEAAFNSAGFSGSATFDRVAFAGTVSFAGATFSSATSFISTSFSDDASFDGAHFSDAMFRNANFSDAFFTNVIFAGDARFGGASFSGVAYFLNSEFKRLANFPHVSFHYFTRFDYAKFEGNTIFFAIRGERGFSLADAVFEAVPDFIQAHFEEAPRLDNVHVKGSRLSPPPVLGSEKSPNRHFRLHHALQRRSDRYRRMTMADRDIPARWRALKRLAVQAHDQDREHEFFAQEIRSARFTTDWPLPWPFWKANAWLGYSRFWFGILYGWFSNYGRSVLLPMFWWALIVLISTAFYLGEHPDVTSHRTTLHQQGYGWLSAWLASTYDAAWVVPEPCYAPPSQPPGQSLQPIIQQNGSALTEAFLLALRTALIAFDPGPESALRTYRCLYGLEDFSGRLVPIVSAPVAYFMIGQKLFSAVMIFLFGLALRNMMKMK